MNLYEILAENSSFGQAATLPDASDESPAPLPQDEDSEPGWTPPPFTEVAATFGCHACDACYLEWCQAVAGKAFYNTRFLRSCPKVRSADECLPVVNVYNDSGR
jgi:hypothetical protein